MVDDNVLNELARLEKYGGEMYLPCEDICSCEFVSEIEKKSRPIEVTYSNDRKKFVANCSSGQSVESCETLASTVRALDLELRFYKIQKGMD